MDFESNSMRSLYTSNGSLNWNGAGRDKTGDRGSCRKEGLSAWNWPEQLLSRPDLQNHFSHICLNFDLISNYQTALFTTHKTICIEQFKKNKTRFWQVGENCFCNFGMRRPFWPVPDQKLPIPTSSPITPVPSLRSLHLCQPLHVESTYIKLLWYRIH